MCVCGCGGCVCHPINQNESNVISKPLYVFLCIKLITHTHTHTLRMFYYNHPLDQIRQIPHTYKPTSRQLGVCAWTLGIHHVENRNLVDYIYIYTYVVMDECWRTNNTAGRRNLRPTNIQRAVFYRRIYKTTTFTTTTTTRSDILGSI